MEERQLVVFGGVEVGVGEIRTINAKCDFDSNRGLFIN
jgi:hypothetical protein